MSDSGDTLPSGSVLVDTLRYPREFSFSLVCSLLLHLAMAAVLLQGVRFPSVETVRDVFLTPDWTEMPPPTPQLAGGGPRELPPRSSPAPRRPSLSAPAPVAAPPPTVTTRKSDPVDVAAPKQALAPRPTPAPPAPPKVEEVAIGPSVAPDAVVARALAPPARPGGPIEDPVLPPAPLPEPVAVAPPPQATAPEPGPVQAPTPVAQPVPVVPKVEERPLPPPSEWRDAQPLLAAPELPPSNAANLPVASSAPSLGLPVPAAPRPTVASVAPPPPLQAPLDWEVPVAPEKNFSSVGRAQEGPLGAVRPAIPEPAVSDSPRAQLPQSRPGAVATPPAAPAARSGSDHIAAPQRGPAQLSTGTGSTPLSSPALSAHRTGERATLGGTTAGAAGQATTAASLGRDATGPAAIASVAPSGADARGTAAGGGEAIAGPAGGTGQATTGVSSGTGESAVGGPASGEVKSDTGTGAGGQAIAQGGGAGTQERGSGRGAGGGIAITTPQNGFRLSADEPPIVIVRGQVEDPAISAITLVTNSRRVEVPVRDGKFNYPLVIIDPTTRISAEMRPPSERRSEAIVVHAAPNPVTTGVILIDWGEAKPPGTIEMGGTWRAKSDRLEGPNVKLFVKSAPMPDDVPVSAFYLRNMQSGVYTFILGYQGLGAGTPFVPKFYLTSPGIPTARELQSVSVSGSGKRPAVRVLLPQAVSWDQDDWFTGRSEAVDTITKFRDDGISWIERKGEVK